MYPPEYHLFVSRQIIKMRRVSQLRRHHSVPMMPFIEHGPITEICKCQISYGVSRYTRGVRLQFQSRIERVCWQSKRECSGAGAGRFHVVTHAGIGGIVKTM